MSHNDLIKDAKDSVKLGVISMAGLGVTGSVSKLVPGSSGIQSSVGTALTLTNVGQVAKVGMNLTNILGKK